MFQGLKSWAAKFHPQLPLSQRESQRLLTALTSSFRRQLEDTSAPSGSDESRPKLPRTDAPKTGSQGLHSSAALFADKHLASVLTNPLLARDPGPRKPDYATVKVTLQKNPGKHPIELLEEYQASGHADITIAVACLEHFLKSLENLSKEERASAVRSASAGKRVLLWVWNHKIYELELFSTDKRLAQMMVPLVVEEGADDYIWEWLQVDHATTHVSERPRRSPSDAKTTWDYYQWKGVVVRQLVTAYSNNGSESLDDALKTYFRAVELKCSGDIPLAGAMQYVYGALKHEHTRRQATDITLYDRFTLEVGSDRFLGHGSSPAIATLPVCWLHLLHPRQPFPGLAFQLLRRTFHPTEAWPTWRPLRNYIESPRLASEEQSYYTFFKLTIVELQDVQRNDDAEWVHALARKLFRRHNERMHEHIRNMRADMLKIRHPASAAAEAPTIIPTAPPKPGLGLRSKTEEPEPVGPPPSWKPWPDTLI